jgi:hypothetical protein
MSITRTRTFVATSCFALVGLLGCAPAPDQEVSKSPPPDRGGSSNAPPTSTPQKLDVTYPPDWHVTVFGADGTQTYWLEPDYEPPLATEASSGDPGDWRVTVCRSGVASCETYFVTSENQPPPDDGYQGSGGWTICDPSFLGGSCATKESPRYISWKQLS